LSLPEKPGEFATLIEIVARLRAPDGCPWDRQQTHRSLRESFLQECYEVLEALDEGDSAKLRDELGDLLLHVVLQTQIATEAGEFELADILQGINKKLVHRHPHVFGSRKVEGAEEVMHNWQALKRQEKETDTSMLASVPHQMPALDYSQEVQRRWEEVDGVIEKLSEEVGELKQAGNQERRAQEFGDLLFTLANIARRLGVDLESALREANRRFYRRFSHMEEICRQRGVNIADLSFDEQNTLWEEAKKRFQE